MLILSKNPIINCRFQPFDFDTKLELMVLEKGMLACTVKSPKQEYVILSTHLVALGLSESPTNPHVEIIRSKQIKQLIKYANILVSENPNRLLVITGDFNAGPEASNSNYMLLLDHFIDLFALDEQENGENTIRYTWLPGFDDNIAARKIFKESPPQRIDMILIPKDQKHLLTSTSDVEIIPNTFSDHSAVVSEITTD